MVKNALFITGGWEGSIPSYDGSTATTEYIYANGTVQSGPNLPAARNGHTANIYDRITMELQPIIVPLLLFTVMILYN